MQTTPNRSEERLMDQNPPTLRFGSENPPSRRGHPNRHVIHSCPYCPKQYTVSTWLDKHVKDKHSAEFTSEWSQSLADMIYSRRSIANSATPHSQHSVPQELLHSTLIRDLQAISSSLKSFVPLIPLIDNLVALLQDPSGIPSRAHSIDRGHLRDLKTCSSSRDMHEQNKHQGTSTSASDVSIPRTTDSMNFDDLESQNASPTTTLFEGEQFGLDSSKRSRSFARYPSFARLRGARLPLSQQNTLSSQVSASEFSQRQRKSRSSRAPRTLHPTSNATHTFHAFPRQQQRRLSPCEQLAAYPHDTSPGSLAPEWAPPESIEHTTDTSLQNSLDGLSQEPVQHFSPFGALQQSSNYPGPASQHSFDYAFVQTPQQYDFGNGLNLDQSDFLTLPVQPGEALEQESHHTPFGSSFLS